MNYFVFSIFVVKGFSFAGDETIYDSFEEGFREREVRALEQRRMPNAIEGELVAHLLIEPRIGQRVGR